VLAEKTMCFVASDGRWYPGGQGTVIIEQIGGSDVNIRKTKTVITVGNAWHNLHKTVVVSLPATGRMLAKMSKDWSWR